MKRCGYFLFILFCGFIFAGSVNAKAYSDAYIKRYANDTPRAAENNVASLVKYLTAPFDNDYDKAKVISFWIAGHISYDEYLFNNNVGFTKLHNGYKPQTADQILKSRVGICVDFSLLFYQMTKVAGIKGGIITGTVVPASKKKQRRMVSEGGHMWNFFQYQDKIVYVDTTFMSLESMEVKHRVSESEHKAQMKKVADTNKYHSKKHDYTSYYFDFTYASEKKTKAYIRTDNKIYR